MRHLLPAAFLLVLRPRLDDIFVSEMISTGLITGVVLDLAIFRALLGNLIVGFDGTILLRLGSRFRSISKGGIDIRFIAVW